MEFYLVVHGIAAVVLIAVSFGHIYMGTAALEGTFEVMKTGYCDSNWAKDHHDIWYEKVKGGGEPAPQDSAETNPDSEQRGSTGSA
jgi:formate dehydrogenase subunit gamma